MHGAGFTSALASSCLLVSGASLIGGIIRCLHNLRELLNLCIEGINQSHGIEALGPILIILGIGWGVTLILLALVGLMQVPADYQVMLRPNMVAAGIVIALIISLASIFSNARQTNNLSVIQDSMLKYAEVESVKFSWDQIQTEVTLSSVLPTFLDELT